mgnify:FL=1
MDRDKKFEKSQIEKLLTENFIKLMPTFYEMQSSFLSGIYKRYGDLEGGNIVIFFARDLHLEILRKREMDLNFDLSLDNFWNNHKNVVQNKKKIIYISKQTGLPKETTRRKLLNLVKKKHIKKGDKNKLFWEPSSEFKESYIKIIEEQIVSLSKFIYEQGKFLDLNLSYQKIQKEIRSNYSFFWYHYLTFELQYIKFWQEKLNDLEMLLIGMQTLIQSLNFVSRKTSGDFNAFFLNKIPKNINMAEANISATSISEVTGIPRPTCIRKLERFVKMRFLEKDRVSKRYYLLLSQLNTNSSVPSIEGMKKTINIFSQFSSIILKGLSK